MDQKNAFSVLDDSELENVGGGYFQVSKWRSYVAGTVVPALNALYASAPASDQQIIQLIYSKFQQTVTQDAAIAGPINGLYSTFLSTYRCQLKSGAVAQSLESILQSAVRYIQNNS